MLNTTRFFLRASAISLLILASCTAQAYERFDAAKVEKLLNTLNPEDPELAPTAEDIRKISTLKPNEFETYFQIILEVRIRKLAPAEQAYIRNSLRNKILLQPIEDDFGGTWGGIWGDNDSGEIRIEYQPQLKDRLLYFSILFHELEHSLQILRPEKVFGSDVMKVLDERGRFYCEHYAMLAEWYFAKYVPESMRKLEWTTYIPLIPADHRAEFVRRLNWYHLSPAKYLEEERKHRRYSYGSFFEKGSPEYQQNILEPHLCEKRLTGH